VAELAIFISKRLQRAMAAFLCLMAIQLVSLLAGGQPQPTAVAAHVAISR
jgi:hypothetical protein